jgi:SAM-dependent methyltransferase
MGSYKSLEEIYNGRFFCRRNKLHWRAVPICDALQRIWKMTSVVDVGCATGDIIQEFEKRGIFGLGI